MNLETGHVDVVLGKDIGGVGSVAVHPSRQYFAIGGIGDRPNVLIYRVEDLSVHRVLRDGTERVTRVPKFSSFFAYIYMYIYIFFYIPFFHFSICL